MTKGQQLKHWQALTDLLRAARHGESIDHSQAAELARILTPHAPGFRYTLNRIAGRAQA